MTVCFAESVKFWRLHWKYGQQGAGEVLSFHEVNITYPESAMMNDMKRGIEDTGCQDSEYGSWDWDVGMYLNGVDCYELWVVKWKKFLQKEGQSICTASCPTILFPCLVPVCSRQQFSFLSFVLFRKWRKFPGHSHFSMTSIATISATPQKKYANNNADLCHLLVNVTPFLGFASHMCMKSHKNGRNDVIDLTTFWARRQLRHTAWTKRGSLNRNMFILYIDLWRTWFIQS